MPLKILSFLRPSVRPAGSSRRRRAAARGVAAGAARLESLECRRLLATDLVSAATAAGAPPVEGALEPSVSADGNLVAFSSDASNFGAADTNGARDVYLHNRQTGTTVLVSRTTGGAAGNGASSEPSISTDGAWVSFSSVATDLAGGQSAGNTTKDIFIYEVATGTVTQVSLTSAGGQPGQFSAEPNTNGNGAFVAYTSPTNAASLVGGTTDNNGLRDVFLWNRAGGTAQLVSTTPTLGTTGNAASFDPSVSSDGRYVAFRSEANDLVPTGDTNGARDIYMRDMAAASTILVSRTAGGIAGNGASDSPSISADGNVIVFSSVASDLSPDDTTPAGRDIFVYNRANNSVTLVSHNQARNGSGNGDSSEPSISQDGRFVAFTSLASDLVANDTNGVSDIFVYDIQTGAMNRVSVDTAGAQGNGDSTDANIAPLGLFVAFTSKASNFSANDTNGAVNDAFVASAPDRGTGNTNPPTATVTQASQPAATVGSLFLDFVVTYADDVDLATTTFDGNDITVTPPGGTPQAVTMVGSSGSGTSATVTYQIPAPGGVLDEADNGLYTITIRPGEVKDANNNAVAAGPLPALQVTVTAASGPDLVSTIQGPLPAVVGGSRGKARVTVTNQGDQPTPKGALMTLQLWLSADGTIDANDTLLATQTKKFSAKPGKGKRFNLKFVYNAPAGGPNYQMLAFADATNTIAESREYNNVGAAAVNVSPPFVDIATSVGVARPTAISGKKFSLPVTLTNNGNVPAVGTVAYTVVASTDDVLGNADDILVTPAPITRPLKVKNGPKGKRSKLAVVLPPLSGVYRFFVTSNFTGTTLGDSVATNNTDSTDNTVTVS